MDLKKKKKKNERRPSFIDLAIRQPLLVLEVNGYETSKVYVARSMTVCKSFLLHSYIVHELHN